MAIANTIPPSTSALMNATLVVVRGGGSAGIEPDLVVGVEVRCVLALGAEKRILDGMLLAKA
jgi:hypothetical protein